MRRLDEALNIIAAEFGAVAGIETAGLGAAAGRILARDLRADTILPAADNSAVDGYALRAADLGGELAIVGRAAAGRQSEVRVGPGQAVRIFTGAVIPAGADTVAMQEIADVEGDRLRLTGPCRPGANIRHAGEVLMPGDLVLAAGQRLTPPRLGLIADLGHAAVDVRTPLRVALLSSGDELVPIGTAPRAHQVIDSNRALLRAALAPWHCRITDYPVLPDDRRTIIAALREAAATHDLVITTAGMSVGEEDHMRAAIETNGTLLFQRLALKPGRPVGLGRVGPVPVLGLPGNPGAVTVAFMLLGQRLLQVLTGAARSDPPRFPLPAGFSYAKPAGDRAYMPGRIVQDEQGIRVERVARYAAGHLAWSMTANGLIEVAEAVETIEPGTLVDFIPFDGFGA